MIELNKIIHGDCMDVMKDIPDNYFELAIVDPPYGLNIAKMGSIGADKFEPKTWDSIIPNDYYFDELFRVSQNQIIWGGNYFIKLWKLPCKDFIIWNKLNHHPNRSDVEFAWTSFNGLSKYFEYMWDGNRYGTVNNIQGVGKKTIRIHPTQKPVALYKWLLHNYAKQGDKILDTHSGSGTTAMACIDMGFDYLCIEKDKDYFEASVKRINKENIKIKMDL